jgi:DNA recombination protein RmuC
MLLLFTVIVSTLCGVLLSLLSSLRNKIDKLEKENKLLLDEKILLEKNISGLIAEYRISCNTNKELQNKLSSYELLKIENEKQKIQIEEQKNNLTAMKEIIDQMKNDMILHFKNISNDVIKQQKSDFELRQKESLGILLSPLNQQLTDFNKKIVDFNKDSTSSAAEIKGRIEALINQTVKIGDKADNLADALKGDKKAQGNWGELKLMNLLEMAGLRKNEDFFTQKAEKNDDGETVIFDFVVKIPNEKYLIIDSKVSIINYEKYITANTDEEKEDYMKLYCGDIKKHIEELGKKEYHSILKTNSPDFVFMFLPLENAYLDAIGYDKDLFRIAMKNKVAMTTASSLIPVVNMINNLWNIEKQNKNIGEIVKLARTIFEKIRNFVGKMENIEKNIDNAKKSCAEAKGYLQSGRENVLRTVNKMISLAEKNKEGDLFFSDIEEDNTEGDILLK